MTQAIATGTNCWTKAEDKLASVLSQSPGFQAFTGTTTDADALGLIFFDSAQVPEFGEEYTPQEFGAIGFALVFSSTNQPYAKRRSSKNANRWIPSGNAVVEFFRFLSEQDTAEKNYSARLDRDLRQRVGDIIDDAIATLYAEIDSVLYVREWSVQEGPFETDEYSGPSAGSWQGLTLGVQWSEPD